jgi:mannose-6-phosphate isomerase-like protein (cupin superfamily)
MPQSTPIVKAGQNFAAVDLGAFSELNQFKFEIPSIPLKLEGKVFLKQLLNLTSAEISISQLPPGQSIPFYHKHQLNEEIYLFIRGTGEFQVDDRIFPAQEGTAVRVDCEGDRCIRNTSPTEALVYVVIQARTGSSTDHTIQDGVRVQKPVSWEKKRLE